MDVTRLIAVIIFCYFLERTSAFPLDNDDSDEEDPTTIVQMGQHLDDIPQGRFSVISANFAYNDIEELPAYVLYINLYKSLQSLELSHNKISSVALEAFRDARQLKTLDLSNNNISFLEANVFRYNHRLEKVDLAYNNVSFDPEKPFIRSPAIQTLVLSHNQIIHVYDITFIRLPNLRTILLDSNPLYYLSPNCFVQQRHLQYVSLASTGVYRLTAGMFRTVPRLVDLTSTALAKKIEPPLKKVKGAQLVKLMNIEKDVLGDDYDT